MIIIEHDAITQTTTSRQATKQEQETAAAALAEMQEQSETLHEQIENKQAAVKKLKALGLTDAEISALVG